MSSSAASLTSSRSLSVSARADSPPPRRLMPLWSASSPPDQHAAFDLVAVDRGHHQFDLAVVEDQLVARRHVLGEVHVRHADAAVGAVVRREIRIERERRALGQHALCPPAKRSMRIFGTLQVAEQRHVLADALPPPGARVARARGDRAGSPCEKLTRSTSAPARMTSSSTSGASVAGPSVATILVRRLSMPALIASR